MASENEFQKFWWYQYGIKDVQVILSKLELNNFIEIGSIADTVMNQKLNQLKQILKNSWIESEWQKRRYSTTSFRKYLARRTKRLISCKAIQTYTKWRKSIKKI